MKDTQRLGAAGETAAADFLRRKHYRILGKNYRCRGGELDIIAQQKETIVFVEVKSRRIGGYAAPSEYVTPEKQRHLRCAAEQWLVCFADADADCRFDVIEVYFDAKGEKVLNMNHMEDAL